MSTREAATAGGDTRGHAPASRIVRIGRTAGPWLVGLTVLATVTFAVPTDAWLPRSAGPLTGAAWEVEPHSALDAIVALQVALGGWVWRPDAVLGAIGIAAVVAAAAALIVLRSWVFLHYEQADFDADQAIVGLMALQDRKSVV